MGKRKRQSTKKNGRKKPKREKNNNEVTIDGYTFYLLPC